MRRRIFTLTSALSLLLCVGIIAARGLLPWAKHFRCYTAHHCIETTSLTAFWKIEIEGGDCTADGGLRAAPGKQWNGTWANPTNELPLGFWYGTSPDNDPTAAFYFCVVIPSSSLMVFFSLMPCLWLYLRLRRKVRPPGTCRQCDYDLTGNTSGICPECGTKIA